MYKFPKSLLVTTALFATGLVQAAGALTPLPPTTVTHINDKLQAQVRVPALEKAINDVQSVITSGYHSTSSTTAMINGHSITAYTPSGAPLGKLKVVDANTGGRLTKKTTQVSVIGRSPEGSSEPVILVVDGVNVFDGKVFNVAEGIDLGRLLEILPVLDAVTSTSLASTSPASASSQIVFNQLDSIALSHRERRAVATRPRDGINFAMADLRYEQARFTHNDEDGDIKGVLMSVSTEVAGVELGAYIPYDYLDFESFSAHRTGTVLYAKRIWELPQSLQLTTLVNFNYLATYATDTALTHTFGGGFGTSLSYDDGGDFIPRASFALQYNEDDYHKANDFIKDNHQLLVKVGASLGYRLFENATVQAGFVYNHDVTDYSSAYNKIKDNDYFDLSIGGSYAIADMWQVNLNYKRILGLNSYYSNTVFLGTSIGF